MSQKNYGDKLLSIEKHIPTKPKYKNFISNFASQNARKMCFELNKNYNLEVNYNLIDIFPLKPQNVSSHL